MISTETKRPRRSALYVPGDNLRAMEKAQSLPADVIILDLEDAVAPDRKAEARRRIVETVDERVFAPREVIVRINALGTEWHDDDLRAVAGSAAAGVLVPKVSSADEVRQLAESLDVYSDRGDLELWAMIETPTAVLHTEDIASASERLTTLVIGTNDLLNGLRAQERADRGTVSAALQLGLLGARSAGKDILDGVFNAIRDDEGFRAEATQGRALGFDGKTVIHPSQIEPANAIFGPSESDVERARETVAHFEQALADGKSVAVVEGRMIEELHVQESRRILDLAEAINELDRGLVK
ncbi:CoA ester lyase [Gordonia sp. SCSIO 19800]|uniref:HpcH/HpaI aldolase/citrate lyase family protein n=1 Tax=Gordonia sp. SCSIO 19800 TaxID=2826926 RepID=UPI0027DD5206|nr:CoA ester lyase [Gordonia sp. SCSIO 19800]